MSFLRRNAALFAIASLATIIIFGRLPGNGRWVVVIADSAHGPISALIAACIFHWQWQSVEDKTLIWRCWLTSIVATVAIGALIEIAQYFIGRDAGIKDVLNDLLGAIAGTGICVILVLRHLPRSQRRRSIEITALLATVCSLATVTMPAAFMGLAYYDRVKRFPTLMDPNALTGLYFLQTYQIHGARHRLSPDMQNLFDSRHSYRVHVGKLTKWGLGLYEFPQDWSQFKFLTINLINPSDATLSLRIRVFSERDKSGRRPGYITKYTTQRAGPHQWKIPLDLMKNAQGKQHVELNQLQGLVIHSAPDNRAENFDIVDIRLN